MSEQPITHVLTVRGRPVGFQPSRWGGALVAVERGYFPLSATGFRSLAGEFGRTEDVDPGEIPFSFFELLAVTQDRERRALLARVSRAPEPGSDRLINFIAASSDAEQALTNGLFASDEERAALWQGAWRLFCLIDSDAQFQPVPSAPRWTEAHCAAALAARRKSRRLLGRLAQGDFPGEAPEFWLSARGYFDLPARAGGEPGIALPGVTAALAPDPPPPGKAATDDEGRATGAQLALF